MKRIRRSGRGSGRGRLRGSFAAAVAMTAMLGTGAAVPAQAADGSDAKAAAAAPRATPLPPELEKIRAAEATKLYGSPAERPMADRKTGLISLGDSEISGEGVGTYEPGTDGPDNWCHRSPDAAIHRTGIPADVTYNVACSGAQTVNIRIGGQKQYADELVQSDSLAIKARNTRIKTVLLVIGANDDLQFAPVMTDCVTRYLLLQGPCAGKYNDGWQARVDALVPKVEQSIRDLKTVMRDAGYQEGDYKLVAMGYPSPIGPDFRDNPKFPGKLACGGLGYDSDTEWGRNYAVPAFETGMRRAARNAGATYLDNSRLFHGHEVCMEDTWARGLYVDVSNPFPPDSNSVRQSFHPNARGHAAFASCLTQIQNSGKREASCADPASTGSPKLYELAWDDVFKPLKNEGTGTCLDVDASASRNGTKVQGWECTGNRNQTWWYDDARGSLHTGLTQDRCVDVPDGSYKEGTAVTLWNCHGGGNQKFVREAGTVRPAAASEMCLTLAGGKEPVRLQKCTGAANQRFA
ncbi:ricin-type beta-trefoil lectin domain protein [Streptomyces sp. NPDC029674]|uniref:ricin-type beta-trefoil lectin domain protein n=1 Tax=Streptomyces sp. NPDC029674 TaxID=3365297 RepID=UPI00384D1810